MLHDIVVKNLLADTAELPTTRVPLGGLLALSAAAFLTVVLQTMPAAILPEISSGMAVSESAAGQLITIYAAGSIVGAIPIMSATMGWPRRRLLASALSGFVLTTLVVAMSESFTLTLVARFITGLFAGVVWGMAAGYASGITPEKHRGRGITIALSGAPIALAIGTPVGALLSGLAGWRSTFIVLTVLAVVVLVWVLAVLPDFPSQPKGQRTSAWTAVKRPGVAPIIVASIFFVIGHYLLYPYSSSPLGSFRMTGQVSGVLLAFGVSALIALCIIGTLVDRYLRLLMLLSIVLFAVSMSLFASVSGPTVFVYVADVAWGLAFGGAGSALPPEGPDGCGRSGGWTLRNRFSSRESMWVSLSGARSAG